MKTPKITPRGKQVLIQPDGPASRISEHGIATPDNVEKEQRSISTVVAVGKDVTDIKKGDRVIYGTYAGDDLKLNESTKKVDYKLVDEEFVLAFIQD